MSGELAKKSSPTKKGGKPGTSGSHQHDSGQNFVTDKIIIDDSMGASSSRTSPYASKKHIHHKAREASKSHSVSQASERTGDSGSVKDSSESWSAASSISADSSSEVQIEMSRPEGANGAAGKHRESGPSVIQDFIADPASVSQEYELIQSLQKKAKYLVDTSFVFRLLNVFLILTDFILVIVDLSVSNCVSSNDALEAVSHAIISFFLLEVCLRIFARGWAFFKVFWDVVDLVVVIVSFIIDIVFLALSPDSCEEEEIQTTAFARLIVLGRTVRIIRIIRILYFAYTQRRRVPIATRQLVSQNKRRYQKDGFDLDLCYITERVIAMSFPSKGVMAVYRNPVEEVARFFNTKHKDHYRIYNLCSERDYDESLFFNNVERILIDDHNVPKVREMLEFCNNAREWMEADPSNVMAIHCKGGKGRTGTLICVWLLECGLFEAATTTLEYFGDRRTDLSKGSTFQGVETPSQSRYVAYFEKMKNEYDRELPPMKVLRINSFTITCIAGVGKGDGSDFFIKMQQDSVPIFECNLGTGQNCKVVQDKKADSITIFPKNCPDLRGDIKVMFMTRNKDIPIGYDKCPFFFWFYTSFIENDKLTLGRAELDNPHKLKTHHVFRPDFSVIIDFKTVL